MLTEETKIDLIEIINFEIIQVRMITNIFKNKEKIASNYSRTSYMKDQDLSNEDPRILEIAKIIWPNYDPASVSLQMSGSVEAVQISGSAE